MPLEVQSGNRTVSIPDAELKARFSRASGPGGQHVNKTETRVELTFDLAGSPSVPEHLRQRALARLEGRLVEGWLTVASSSRRSQLQNREEAERRLVDLLEMGFAPPPKRRRKTKPTRSSVEKRIGSKKRRGETKRLRRRVDD